MCHYVHKSYPDISETESGIIEPLVSKRRRKEFLKKSKNILKFSFKKKIRIFGETLDVLDFSVIFYFFNALSNHCTVAWVTRPERLKGHYLEFGPQRGP